MRPKDLLAWLLYKRSAKTQEKSPLTFDQAVKIAQTGSHEAAITAFSDLL